MNLHLVDIGGRYGECYQGLNGKVNYLREIMYMMVCEGRKGSVTFGDI